MNDLRYKTYRRGEGWRGKYKRIGERKRERERSFE
jgi:hypothetical protein